MATEKYKVRVTETLVRIVEIDAMSYEQAEELVVDKFDKQSLVLNHFNDFLDVDFSEEES